MKDKFIEWENRIFSAPYKWLIKKGYIVAKRIYLTMEDLYEEVYLGDYKGNPNWSSDDQSFMWCMPKFNRKIYNGNRCFNLFRLL